jgi:hypothetical protein
MLNINFENRIRNRTDFFGTLIAATVTEVGVMKISFTGVFNGYIGETGIRLECASLDIST